ncbi:hypothetical protein QR680_012893 [Steinernema hermaphroditum]|uniref:PX domain-containing protein n=1 Tax=Steinernema hermaphroditum TaxID=289476 RepID=A0AA39M1K5_9BILA|nr:hypothetical protein QR680_012893 [Steinernema hermaphroditum]
MAPDAIVDPTHPLTCTICDWNINGGHVEYEIECKRAFDETPWRVVRRYREFDALHRQLRSFGAPLRLPPKYVFGCTKERVVKARLSELQGYLNALTVSPVLYASPHVVAFLTAEAYADRGAHPANTTGPLLYVRNAFLTAVRNRHQWTLCSMWENVGWRYNKGFASVRLSGGASRKEPMHLVSWMPLGIDHCREVGIEDMEMLLQVIRDIKSPYISDAGEAWADRRGVGLVAPIYDGTLRDHLYKSRADEAFLLKYGFDRQVYSLERVDVCFIGRQVLEALQILHSIPVPFVNVHCGNVLVTDMGCEILDVEFALCGQPSLYRAAMIRSTSVNTLEDMMVFAFGELIYELITGFIVFPDHTPEQAIALCPAPFHDLLKSVFQPQVSNGLPSLEELTKTPLFANVPVVRMSKKEISIPGRAKRLLDKLTLNIEKRLQEEQIQFSKIRKLEEWQQFINSEEQRTIRKKIVQAEQLKMTKNANS